MIRLTGSLPLKQAFQKCLSSNPAQYSNLYKNCGPIMRSKELGFHFSTTTKTNPKLHGFDSNELSIYFKNKEQQSLNHNYQYRTKVIYDLTEAAKRGQLNNTSYDSIPWNKMYIFQTVIWAPLTYLIYFSFGPVTAILPLIGCGLTLFSTRKAQTAMNSMMAKLELQDSEHVVLYPLNNPGNGIVCKIEGANLTKVSQEQMKSRSSSNEFDTIDTVILTSNFVQAGSKSKKIRAIFKVSSEECTISNLDLFKSILYGKYMEIQSYKPAASYDKWKH